jgi:uroporphyrinogen-III synthase
VRVVVTKLGGRGGELARRLEAQGHEVLHVPLTEVVDGDPFPDPSGFDGVLFTSASAAARAPRGARWPRVGAVGEATARALEARGIRVAVVGTGGGAELARAWGEARGRRLLLPQAREAHPALAAALRAAGAEVTCAAVYETRALRGVDPAPFESADAVCFFAPSAVRAYRALRVVARPRLWALGPTTRAALEGLPRVVDDL